MLRVEPPAAQDTAPTNPAPCRTHACGPAAALPGSIAVPTGNVRAQRLGSWHHDLLPRPATTRGHRVCRANRNSVEPFRVGRAGSSRAGFRVRFAVAVSSLQPGWDAVRHLLPGHRPCFCGGGGFPQERCPTLRSGFQHSIAVRRYGSRDFPWADSTPTRSVAQQTITRLGERGILRILGAGEQFPRSRGVASHGLRPEPSLAGVSLFHVSPDGALSHGRPRAVLCRRSGTGRRLPHCAVRGTGLVTDSERTITMTTTPNNITRPNAGGPHQFSI